MKLMIYLASSLCIALAANGANALTYYVDATGGNDAWTGRLSAPAAAPVSDGPWKTLARIGTALLQPGDVVLLKCGQTWFEPLAIASSGTAVNPITVSSYPSSCSDRPLIDGSILVPAHNWVQHSGSIYRAALPPNLISNSTFDSSLTGWRVYSAKGDAALTLDRGCNLPGAPCMALTSGAGPGNSIVSSNNFSISASASYTALLTLKAPPGVRVWVVLRRSGPPYEALGLSTWITGTGSWQSYSLPFRALASLSNARLDFELSPGGATLGLNDVRMSVNLADPQQVFSLGNPLDTAHHPNRGFDSTRPNSLYLKIAQDSDRISQAGAYVSTYLTTGPDLVLPPGTSLAPGLTVRFRTSTWLMEERRIASVSGSRMYFNQPTTYPLYAAFGYYLSGALWMLDSPGEWHYDTATRQIYVWMPDNAPPGDRIAVGQAAYGIDVSGRSYVVIDGIAVRRVGTGVKMPTTSVVTLRNSSITDTLLEGIDASASTNGTIERNLIARTGRDAVSGIDASWRAATNLRVVGNDIYDSGVRFERGAAAGLPTPSFGAIRSGKQAYIAGNRIINAGYVGIVPMGISTTTENYVENTCLVLDDCAGIYVNNAANNSTITRNLVSGIVGTGDGKPVDATHVVGIYLDDLASGVAVSGNTAVGADYGIQLHNAYNNRIEDNTLYGNRRNQLWMQEQTKRLRASGDLYGNQVRDNRFVPTTTDPSVVQETDFANTVSFATYDGNQYSSLFSPRTAVEQWAGGGASYTLAAWKAAVTSAGAARNLDPNGTEVTITGYASFQTAGATLISNGDFKEATKGWHGWNQIAPYGQVFSEACIPGRCLRYAAGASESILSSPYFSVVKDRWYRVAFDLKTGAEGQAVAVLVRRGGGGSNTYERLMSAPETVAGSTSWKRFAFVFKATKTVNAKDPITLDNGARIDFERIQPGQAITIANVELLSLTPMEASLQTRILLNPAAAAASLPCPDEMTQPRLCGQYVRFRDGSPIDWPYTVPARGSEICYTRDTTLSDADGDGIADIQDNCFATAMGEAVDAQGCAFSQSYP